MKALLTLISGAMMVAATTAGAADYPSKPIEVVIPFSQGGGTDYVGRAFAQWGEKYIGGKMFASNRTGASGAVGFKYGADAKPDGHVVTMTVTSLASGPHTVEGFPVSYKDFEPVCLIAALNPAIVVRQDSQFKTAKDLLDYTKKHPGELRWGTGQSGSNGFLASVQFAKETGTDYTFMPYAGGAKVLTALLGGHIDVGQVSTSEPLQYVQSGQMRMLMVMGSERYKELPDVPTSVEMGYNVDVGYFRAIGAPLGTPKPIIDKLIDTCKKVVADPEFIAHLAKRGVAPTPKFGADFGEWFKKQDEIYAAAAVAAGLK